MFNVGGGELLVIALVALIVLGPDRLPGALRTAGQWMGEIRRMSAGFQTDFKTALADAEREAEEAKKSEAAGDEADTESTELNAAAPMAPIVPPTPSASPTGDAPAPLDTSSEPAGESATPDAPTRPINQIAQQHASPPPERPAPPVEPAATDASTDDDADGLHA